MSRKTNAELEAEVLSLRRELEQCRDHNKMFSDFLDDFNKERQAMNKYYSRDIKKFTERLEPLMIALNKYSTGPQRNKENAKERQKYRKERYSTHREEGKNVTESREQANKDVFEKYGAHYGIGERRLRELLKD